jgi:dihydrofolate reductase
MAKLIFGMMQSLDGYVDHLELGPPGPLLARHFVEHLRGVSAVVYGRRLYEIMRYWDDDQEDWDAGDRDFAAVWRNLHKWVASRSLRSVGPNATLVENDLGGAIRRLKEQMAGEIEVGGPDLAGSLTDLRLIDEYRLYFRPIVLGHGTPFFSRSRPQLRLLSSDLVGEDTMRLTYIP